MYLADYGGNTVARFTSTGRFLGSFGASVPLVKPIGVALGEGKIFVADSGRIVEFDSAGKPIAVLTGAASSSGLPQSPTALAVDPAGRLYVFDQASSRLLAFEL